MKMLTLSPLAKVYWATYSLRNFSTKTELKTMAQRRAHYGDLFPEKLLNKKMKTPSHMYIASEQAAQWIDRCLDPYLKKTKCSTILEMNPGVGFFSRKLLDRASFSKVILMESMEHFMGNLKELQMLYPGSAVVKHGDLINIGKYVFQDKMDHGTRVAELLRDVPVRAYREEPNMVVFGVVGSYQFLKHLINSLIFQNSLFTLGRCEMFLIVPPPIYVHLTCTNEIGYMIYRSASMLFQILFEYRFIARVSRSDFLPIQSEYHNAKGSKLTRIHSINPEYLYLARIIPRQNLFDLCPPEDLAALWYFIRQNCVSRRNRIIPSLEKWVPGCGPRLIINKGTTQPVKPLYPDEDVQTLPQYSSRCTTMSCRDYYPNINIYTEFGDLTASQMLTLFTEFRQWPEYSDSSFLASYENSMLKLEAAADEFVDGITEEDDDIAHDISHVSDKLEMENLPNITTEPTSKPVRGVKKNS